MKIRANLSSSFSGWKFGSADLSHAHSYTRGVCDIMSKPFIFINRMISNIDEWYSRRSFCVKFNKRELYDLDTTLSTISYPLVLGVIKGKHGSPVTDDIPRYAQLNCEDAMHFRWDYVASRILFSLYHISHERYDGKKILESRGYYKPSVYVLREGAMEKLNAIDSNYGWSLSTIRDRLGDEALGEYIMLEFNVYSENDSLTEHRYVQEGLEWYGKYYSSLWV